MNYSQTRKLKLYNLIKENTILWGLHQKYSLLLAVIYLLLWQVISWTYQIFKINY